MPICDATRSKFLNFVLGSNRLPQNFNKIFSIEVSATLQLITWWSWRRHIASGETVI